MTGKIRCITYVVTLVLLCATFTSCYRMPEEGEYSLVPATNNPDVVGQKGEQNWLPGAGF